MVRLLNWLGLVRGVYLLDYQNEVYASWVRPYRYPKKAIKLFSIGQPAMKIWCNVYPFTRTGEVILNEDGTSSGSSCYIKRWRWMSEAE